MESGRGRRGGGGGGGGGGRTRGGGIQVVVSVHSSQTGTINPLTPVVSKSCLVSP